VIRERGSERERESDREHVQSARERESEREKAREREEDSRRERERVFVWEIAVLIICWQFGNQPEGMLSWGFVFFCSHKAPVRTPTPTMLRMPRTMNCKWIGTTGGALARSFVRHLGSVCIPKSIFDQIVFLFKVFVFIREKKQARRHNLRFSG